MIVNYTLTANWIQLEAIKIVLLRMKETAFVTVNVGELLFYGYKDNIISPICKVVPNICSKFGIPDRIGLLYKVILF